MGTDEVGELHDELRLEDGDDGLAFQPDHVLAAAHPPPLDCAPASFHVVHRGRWGRIPLLLATRVLDVGESKEEAMGSMGASVIQRNSNVGFVGGYRFGHSSVEGSERVGPPLLRTQLLVGVHETNILKT